MSFCHGNNSSFRVSDAMYSWKITWLGPRGGIRNMKLTPHSQPDFCQKCGFIFHFEGCDLFHLSSCPVCEVAYQKDQHTHSECPNLDGLKVRFVRVGEIP